MTDAVDLEDTPVQTVDDMFVVQTENGYRHVDLTQSGPPVFHTDEEMWALGYSWTSERVPACTAGEEP